MYPKIRVAHIRDRYLKRTETFIYNYITSISSFEVCFFARELENLDLFPFERVFVTSRFWAWERLVNKAAMKYLKRRLLPIAQLAYAEPLRQQRVKLIHAHFGFTGVDMWPLAERLGIPLVTTFYGGDMSALPRREYWRRSYRTLFAHGDLFLVEGSHMKERLVDLGCPRDKIQIVHIGVAVDRMPLPARRGHRSNEKLVLLMCGRFCEKKGIPYGIRALHSVTARHHDIELRIIGDGPLRPQIERLIAHLALEQRIKLLGTLRYDQYLEELRQADVLLAPSVTAADGDTEGGAPTVVIEAQAMGLPVVGTFHADIPEVVAHGSSGFLAEERDVEGLADCLSRLCEDRQLRLAMGQRGRQRMSADYDIRKAARALEDAYNSLLQPSSDSTMWRSLPRC